jgi:MoaA/NifB/PqqE/SkfB family radical SAM enzyme
MKHQDPVWFENNVERYKNVSCVAPFSSMFIKEWQGKSTLLPCCAMETETNLIELDQTLTFKENFDKFGELRSEFLEAGLDFKKYTKCNSCVMNLENSQRFSHNNEASANDHLDYINNPTLTYLHINFSNICNLSCRMCGESSSSMLGRENALYELVNKPSSFFERKYIDMDGVFYKSLLENMEHISYIHFSGGEPFLQPGMWEVLEHLEKINKFDVTLQYNTNGTVKLNDKQKELLLKFQDIQFHVSMDGIYKHAEYVRTGLNWAAWHKNFKDLKATFKNIEIVITISVFNVHLLDKILDFFKRIEGVTCSLNYVYNPSFMSITQISPKAKEFIRKKYQGKKDFEKVIEFMDSKHNENFLNVPMSIHEKDLNAMRRKLYKDYTPFYFISGEWMKLLKEQ